MSDIIKQIRADHEKWGGPGEICAECERPWPCPSYQATEEIVRLQAALTEIMDLDHYPDATIARKALDEQAIHKSAGVCIARDEQSSRDDFSPENDPFPAEQIADKKEG